MEYNAVQATFQRNLFIELHYITWLKHKVFNSRYNIWDIFVAEYVRSNVFWIMTPCRLVNGHQHFWRTRCFLLQVAYLFWRNRQFFRPIFLWIPARLHEVATRKNALWIICFFFFLSFTFSFLFLIIWNIHHFTLSSFHYLHLATVWAYRLFSRILKTDLSILS